VKTSEVVLSLIPVLRRLRQDYKFQVSLDYQKERKEGRIEGRSRVLTEKELYLSSINQ
jgi:hypothetical protein